MADAFILVVETGAGLTTANSYLSVAGADVLLLTHPDYAVNWQPKTTDQKEILLAKATEFLDFKWRWYGSVKTVTQALQWPRTKNYDDKGVQLAAGVVPTPLKKATAMLCIQWSKDLDLYNVIPETGQPKSVSIEGLSVSFDAGNLENLALSGKRYPEIELLLKNLGELKDKIFFDSRRTIIRSMVQ